MIYALAEVPPEPEDLPDDAAAASAFRPREVRDMCVYIYIYIYIYTYVYIYIYIERER